MQRSNNLKTHGASKQRVRSQTGRHGPIRMSRKVKDGSVTSRRHEVHALAVQTREPCGGATAAAS